jgi:hypothetical protein
VFTYLTLTLPLWLYGHDCFPSVPKHDSFPHGHLAGPCNTQGASSQGCKGDTCMFSSFLVCRTIFSAPTWFHNLLVWFTPVVRVCTEVGFASLCFPLLEGVGESSF